MDDIVETARRAEGSDLLPKVSFGLMNAEQLILRMADTIEAMRARVAELEDQIDSAMMSGHDMAKNEYRDIISGLEARVAELDAALIEAERALAGIVDCPAIADGGLGDAAWGCKESALAEREARAALARIRAITGETDGPC